MSTSSRILREEEERMHAHEHDWPRSESASASISVVMPVKNEARRIADCLTALRSQTVTPKEVIVVDGHSTDETVEIAKRFGARILYERYGTRSGACQVGVLAAAGDLVAFTDADCIPEPEWLERLAAGFDEGIAGVGGRIVNEGDSFWEQSIDAALDTLVGSANSVQGRMFAAPRYVSSISGCNSMYRRADLIAVGGYRTDLITTEDTELNHRMSERGRLLYVPEAIVHHRHQRGLRDFGRRMFQYGYGRGQSLLVGPPLLMPTAAVALLFVVWLRPWAAVLLLAAYGLVLLLSSIRPVIRRREPRYLIVLPITFLIEHAAYVMGFWAGLLRTHVLRRRPVGIGGEAVE
ncbi:MAG TPA: glycosyltransferase [Thermoplasmata archaeon]|nr:glycosyltransferase [Thermoplasmata archaeon]